MILVPTPPNDTLPHVVLRTTLSGATFEITWLWNERDRCWYFSLANASGELLCASVRVVIGAVLNVGVDRSKGAKYPILVVDPSGTGKEPTLETLGRAIKVLYMEPDA